MNNTEIFIYSKFEGKGKESNKPFCVIDYLYLDNYNNLRSCNKFLNTDLAKKVQKNGFYKPLFNASGSMSDLTFVREVIL